MSNSEKLLRPVEGNDVKHDLDCPGGIGAQYPQKKTLLHRLYVWCPPAIVDITLHN